MLTREQACIVLDLIELGTDGNWPTVRDGMLEKGHNPGDIEMACGQVAQMADMDNPIDAGDFDD